MFIACASTPNGVQSPARHKLNADIDQGSGEALELTMVSRSIRFREIPTAFNTDVERRTRCNRYVSLEHAVVADTV